MSVPTNLSPVKCHPLPPGFVRIGPREARKPKRNSYRHACTACGEWNKQTINGRCRSCLRKEV